MATVDNAVYVGGRRTADPHTMQETFEVMRARTNPTRNCTGGCAMSKTTSSASPSRSMPSGPCCTTP